jgi:DNA-directed RNA polymerase subunit F
MKHKSITIHGVIEVLKEKIKERSRALHLSQNETILRILEQALLINNNNHRKEFEDLFGIWSKEEADEFENRLKDIRLN